MENAVFRYGKWLCTEQFATVEPLDVHILQKKKRDIELPEQMKNVRIVMRKRFIVRKNKCPYRIRITADDYYHLFINGRLVGQGPAQGYFFCYYWNEFDITDYLCEGENEISVKVFYQGLINRAYNSGDRRMGMVAELYEADTCFLMTDSSWEYAVLTPAQPSEVIGAATQFLEHYDSRKKELCWRACIEKATDYQFSPEPAVPLQVYEKKPVHVKPLGCGGYLYDFGEEITASLNLTACGRKGDRVRILCGEELEESEYEVRYQMRCNCRYEEYWTLDDGDNEYRQYDYKGFRYVALILPSHDVKLQSVKAIVRHYPFQDDSCTLVTDNQALQSVWQICKNAVKYGSQEVFVDCPTREKGQYAGDMTITSASHVVLTGDASLLKKAIDNQMQSAVYTPGLLAVTPGSFWQEIADYSFQFPILALRYYALSGDRDYLKKNLAVCEGILHFFKQYERQDGLLANVWAQWNLVDWPTAMRDGYDFPLEPLGKEPHNVLNAFYIGCVLQTEQIRDLLQIPQQKQSSALIDAFQREFWKKQKGLYTDCKASDHSSLHANVLPLFYGFCPKESERKIGDFLVQKGLCCGVYMAYFVLKALCRLHRYRDAYEMIISQGEHSWMNMIQEGATTCFEAWGKAQKPNTSLCHPWASAPISILAEDILPNLPEVGKLIYKTDPNSRLTPNKPLI